MRRAIWGLLAAFWASGAVAGRRVFGFSPDGRHFAFEQYWAVYEHDAAVSEILILDTLRDRLVAGSPIRERIEGDEGLETDPVRTKALARAKPVLDRLAIGQAGTVFSAVPSRDVDGSDHYQQPDPFSTQLALSLPDGRPGRLAVSGRALGARTCRGPDRAGSPTRFDVFGYALSLEIGGETRMIHADRAVPRSRGCPSGYGIVEAHLHRTGDGSTTLVVVLEYADNDGGHAGANRRFLAVAARL
jgi:predicted secreted protein